MFWKGIGRISGVHVIIHVLRHIEEAFINAKKKLRLLGVTNDALRESNATFGISGEFATENSTHIRREPAAIDQYLHARRNDVMFDGDAVGGMLGSEQTFAAA